MGVQICQKLYDKFKLIHIKILIGKQPHMPRHDSVIRPTRAKIINPNGMTGVFFSNGVNQVRGPWCMIQSSLLQQTIDFE